MGTHINSSQKKPSTESYEKFKSIRDEIVTHLKARSFSKEECKKLKSLVEQKGHYSLDPADAKTVAFAKKKDWAMVVQSLCKEYWLEKSYALKPNLHVEGKFLQRITEADNKVAHLKGRMKGTLTEIRALLNEIDEYDEKRFAEAKIERAKIATYEAKKPEADEEARAAAWANYTLQFQECPYERVSKIDIPNQPRITKQEVDAVEGFFNRVTQWQEEFLYHPLYNDGFVEISRQKVRGQKDKVTYARSLDTDRYIDDGTYETQEQRHYEGLFVDLFLAAGFTRNQTAKFTYKILGTCSFRRLTTIGGIRKRIYANHPVTPK